MSTYTFSTNLKCAGCVESLKQVFDLEPAIEYWRVDIQSPDKILTVKTSMTDETVVEIVRRVGYEAKLKPTDAS